MLTQTVETQTKSEPTLNPKLSLAVKHFAEAKRIYEQAKEAMDTCKREVQVQFELTGESTINIDGASITLVTPVQSKLDKMALLREGVSLAQIERATKVIPSAPYLKVTLPKGGR